MAIFSASAPSIAEVNKENVAQELTELKRCVRELCEDLEYTLSNLTINDNFNGSEQTSPTNIIKESEYDIAFGRTRCAGDGNTWVNFGKEFASPPIVFVSWYRQENIAGDWGCLKVWDTRTYGTLISDSGDKDSSYQISWLAIAPKGA